MKKQTRTNKILEVSIECTASSKAALTSLLNLQGNLKELPSENYKKMKGEMLKYGFIEPVSIWQSPDGKKYILNGHQRVKALTLMAEEGIKVPVELPVNLVNAKNIKEAKQKLLALASQFGVFNKENFSEFIKDIDLSAEEIQEFFEFDKDVDKMLRGLSNTSGDENGKAEAAMSSEENAENYGKNYVLVFYFDKLREFQKVQEIMKLENKTSEGKVLLDILKKIGSSNDKK